MNTVFVLVELYKRETILGVSQEPMSLILASKHDKWQEGDFWAVERQDVVFHTSINELPRYEIREVKYFE